MSEKKRLAKTLRRTVEDWASAADPPVRAPALEAIFSTQVDESQPGRYAARAHLSATMINGGVPSEGVIAAALLERWDEIRTGNAADELQEFLQLSRDEVARQFEELAARIRTVLMEDHGSRAANTKDHRATDVKVGTGRPRAEDTGERTVRTPLGKRLWELRARVVANGGRLLDWVDIDRELEDRRGERTG